MPPPLRLPLTHFEKKHARLVSTSHVNQIVSGLKKTKQAEVFLIAEEVLISVSQDKAGKELAPLTPECVFSRLIQGARLRQHACTHHQSARAHPRGDRRSCIMQSCTFSMLTSIMLAAGRADQDVIRG